MHKAYDMQRMPFIQCDTDSLTWAISGDSNGGPEQLFEAVIKDQQIYDTYKDCVYTNNGKKQILHIEVEKYGLNWDCYNGYQYDVSITQGVYEQVENGEKCIYRINNENDCIIKSKLEVQRCS
ncbi:MAG: hypothetical protein EZS28_050508 [Streblomastix strix]|uniref:Uncharacterized protein n=1 Tax=Streblomastix strix TaxID=222440 RepID=A0A5J4T992_9EUKA|nr:MAG: hypothetical protein EZS28_050508 [Streblomastix strix]